MNHRTAIGNTCYKIFKSKVDWPAARDHCEILDATLASARNEVELFFVNG